MISTPKLVDRPTGKQLAYLRSLAARAGQTFAYPRTRREASREIQQLEQARPSTWIDNLLIDREIADAIACGEEDAARVRPGEVLGYESTATWKERS